MGAAVGLGLSGGSSIECGHPELWLHQNDGRDIVPCCAQGYRVGRCPIEMMSCPQESWALQKGPQVEDAIFQPIQTPEKKRKHVNDLLPCKLLRPCAFQLVCVCVWHISMLDLRTQ